MKVRSAAIWVVLGTATIAFKPLPAQRVSPSAVVSTETLTARSVDAGAPTLTRPERFAPDEGRHPSIGRVAATLLGAGLGAFIGVASVEIYKQTNGKSSCSCNRSADYTGAAIGAVTLGGVAWWLGGKWFD